MMTTLRVVATSSSWSLSPLGLDAARGLRDAEYSPELLEIADLEVGGLDVVRQSRSLAIDPRGRHAHRAGAQHVDVGAVTHEEGAGRAQPHAPERGLEEDRLGLAPADLVGDDDGLEVRREPLPLE